MRCPNCHAEITDKAKYCSSCGYGIKSEGHDSGQPDRAHSFGIDNTENSLITDKALQSPSGFRRTLSTEFVTRQVELSRTIKWNALVEIRTYEPNETMIRQGERNRDLIFITEGRAEISSKKEGDENLVLNEVESPYILGEIGFLSGLPRTATAKAISRTKTFIINYEIFRQITEEQPDWLNPCVTAFVSAVKSLHHKMQDLERRIQELEEAPPR